MVDDICAHLTQEGYHVGSISIIKGRLTSDLRN